MLKKLSLLYLLNTLTDFNQTCIDNLLGKGEELDLIFKVTGGQNVEKWFVSSYPLKGLIDKGQT